MSWRDDTGDTCSLNIILSEFSVYGMKKEKNLFIQKKTT